MNLTPQPGTGARGNPARRRLVLAGFALVLVVVVGLLLYRSIVGMMGGAAPATAAEVAAAPPGAPLVVALRVTQAPAADSFVGDVLDKADGGAYAPTGHPLAVRWTATTPVSMGQRGDVRPGAVLQVEGRVGAAGPGGLEADRIVVLNGLVTVK